MGREVSFEWSLHRVSSTHSKVRATLQNSIIHSGSEKAKQHCRQYLVLLEYFPVNKAASHFIHSTFLHKFIVLQRGYHHARRLNKLNKIKSNDVKKRKKKKFSIKDKMDK